MTVDELRTELSAILAAEEEPAANWDVIEFLSQRIYARLADYGTPPGFPREQVMNYLAGFLQRRLDWRFGEEQRKWLRAYLSEA